jgi:membrane protein required for colicin V production
LFGLVFGMLRGAVVVAVFVLLAQLVELEQTSWWQHSKLLPYTVEFAGWIRNFAETGLNAVDADRTSVRA